MREGPDAVVESLWRARPRELARRALSDMVDDEILKIRRLVPDHDPSVEPLVTAFKAGFAPDPKPSGRVDPPLDPQEHLDLALAYREMGLTDDALNEASLALVQASQLGERTHQAAAIALDPRCLRSGLEDTLASLRSALFPQ